MRLSAPVPKYQTMKAGNPLSRGLRGLQSNCWYDSALTDDHAMKAYGGVDV
jgi:hypothetical protein